MVTEGWDQGKQVRIGWVELQRWLLQCTHKLGTSLGELKSLECSEERAERR